MVVLAGCGVQEEDQECIGDCHLVDEWGVTTSTSFGPNSSEISVAFKEPFYGTVTAKIYSGNSGEMKGADSKTLEGEKAASFEFKGAWSGGATIIIEENETN